MVHSRDSSDPLVSKRWWKKFPSPINTYERYKSKSLNSYQFMATLCFILSLSGFMHSYLVSYGGFIESSIYLTSNGLDLYHLSSTPKLSSFSTPIIYYNLTNVENLLNITTITPTFLPTYFSIEISYNKTNDGNIENSDPNDHPEVVIIDTKDDNNDENSNKDYDIDDDNINPKNEEDNNKNDENNEDKDNDKEQKDEKIIKKINNHYDYNIISNYFTLEAQQIFIFGECCGSLFNSLLVDSIGRRKILIIAQLLHLFVLLYNVFFYSSSTSSWITLRFFHGFILGNIITSTIIYMIEISTSKFRGKSFACFTLMLCLGYSASQISFHYMSSVHGNRFIPSYSDFIQMENQYRYFEGRELSKIWWGIVYNKWWSWFWLYSSIPLLLSIFQILTLLPLPDSPRWILANKTPTDCSKSLKILRRKININKEFNYMYRELAYDARQGRRWKDLFINSSLKYRILINFLLQFSTIFINFFLLIIYSSSVFISTRIINLSIQILILFLLIISLLLFIFLNKTIDSRGRKFIWKVSIILTTCLWLIISIASYFCELSLINNSNSYTIMGNSESEMYSYSSNSTPSSIISFIKSFHLDYYFDKSFFIKLAWFTFSFSLILLASITLMLQNNLSWLYSCEIFPFRIRSKGCSLTLSFRFFFISLLLQMIKYLRHFLGSISPIFGPFYLGTSSTTSFLSVGSLPKLLLILTFLNFISSLLVYLIIPETNGVILEEIEEIFTLDRLNYFCGCFPYWISPFNTSVTSSIDNSNQNEDDAASVESSSYMLKNSLCSTEKKKKLSSLENPYVSFSSSFNFLNSPNPLFNFSKPLPSSSSSSSLNELEASEIDRLLIKPTPLFPFNPYEKNSSSNSSSVASTYSYGTIHTPPPNPISNTSPFISPTPTHSFREDNNSLLFSPSVISSTSSSFAQVHISNSPHLSYQNFSMIDFDPSTLHKYSYEMNSSNFFYQSEDEDEEDIEDDIEENEKKYYNKIPPIKCYSSKQKNKLNLSHFEEI